MTLQQAKYQAWRAYKAEYNRKMRDPHGAGRASQREDSAQLSAECAYRQAMICYGFPDNFMAQPVKGETT